MFQVALGTYDLAFVLGSNKGGQPRISADEHRSELAVETRALSRSSAQVPLLICVSSAQFGGSTFHPLGTSEVNRCLTFRLNSATPHGTGD
jgi:hypothetical protein